MSSYDEVSLTDSEKVDKVVPKKVSWKYRILNIANLFFILIWID